MYKRQTLDYVFTRAHEMGHAMHSEMSYVNQPVVYSDYVIFVAEVASTCNEALLMEYLLNNTTDKREKAYLINYFLEQFRTTLYPVSYTHLSELDGFSASGDSQLTSTDVLELAHVLADGGTACTYDDNISRIHSVTS